MTNQQLRSSALQLATHYLPTSYRFSAACAAISLMLSLTLSPYKLHQTQPLSLLAVGGGFMLPGECYEF